MQVIHYICVAHIMYLNIVLCNFIVIYSQMIYYYMSYLINIIYNYISYIKCIVLCNTDILLLTMALCSIVSGKYQELKMHLIYLTYKHQTLATQPIGEEQLFPS
jgi:hypothetical protein